MQEDCCWWCLDRIVSPKGFLDSARERQAVEDAELTQVRLQDTGRCCDKVNDSSVEGNCGGLGEHLCGVSARDSNGFINTLP